MRRIARIVGWSAICLALLVAALLLSDWGFWSRYFNIPDDPGEWPDEFYRPTIVARGAPAPFFPTAAVRSIAPDVLEAAAHWAAQHNSTALLVLHRNELQLERYWQGLAPDTLFTGRAMSRTPVAMLVGIALAEGRLGSLDEPLSQHLPEWAGDARGRITLRELLHNVSGLEEPQLSRNPFSKPMQLSFGTDFARAALSFQAERPPGERFAVSNANAQLLGIVLERATGVPYEQYFSERLWAPLGAADAEFYLDRDGGMPATYCCFRASARDWLRLGALLVNDGVANGRQVLPPGWVQQMSRSSSVNPHYGLQIWTGAHGAGVRPYVQGRPSGVAHGEPLLAADILYLEGGGFRTLWAIPSRQLVILRLGRASPGWDSSFLPNLLVRALQEAETESEP